MTDSRLLWVTLSLSACFLNAPDGLGPTPSSSTEAGTTTATLPGDLPCSVGNALLVCQSCHGPTPTGGAPVSLASYADLTSPSSLYPGRTEAQRAVARMSGNPTQMPPAPASPPPQSAIDAVSAWIAAGYPAGTCNSQPVCTSGRTVTLSEGSRMSPGQACVSCHQSTGGDAPIYAFMGTVYPTLHEPNDCAGASPTSYAGAQVVVVDANGQSFAMTPNSSGNFMGSPGGFAMPFTAKVMYQGREIDMTTPQSTGDCNGCHTESGANGAPGRVMLP